MTREEFVKSIRQEIREDGFMAASKLVVRIVDLAMELDVEIPDAVEVLAEIPCEDIHVQEYANWMTKEYRRKDLYYFNPDVKTKS